MFTSKKRVQDGCKCSKITPNHGQFSIAIFLWLSKDFAFSCSSSISPMRHMQLNILFKLPRVRVALHSMPTAAYCAYTQNSLHTRLSTRGSLNKNIYWTCLQVVAHGRNRPGTRKTKSLLNERKWRLKNSHDSPLFSTT